MWNRKPRTGPTAGALWSRGTIAAAVAGLTVAAAAAPRAGAAMTTVYSDLTPDPSGYYQPFGPGSSATINGGLYTPLIADDITPIAGHTGEAVSTVDFYLYNGGATAATFDIALRFYDNTGTGDANGNVTGSPPGNLSAPGNLLYSVTSGAVTLQPGSVTNTDQLYELLLPTDGTGFALPSGTFWAGLSLTDGGGTTGATAAQLEAIGPVYANPVTTGSSKDEFFQSDNADTFTSNDPAGGLYTLSGLGYPVADFGFQFVTTSVPEPASFGVIGVATAAGLLRRRRASR